MGCFFELHRKIMSILLVILCLKPAQCFFDIQDIMSETMTRLPRDFPVAIKDIAEGLPAKTMTVVRGNSTSIRYLLTTDTFMQEYV